MTENRPRRVTLTGDRTGSFVITEERPDGTIVLAPDGARAVPKPSGGPLGSMLGGLLTKPKDSGATSVAEALLGWGVDLLPDESVRQFIPVDVDAAPGYVAVTDRRFIFLARQGPTLHPVQDRPLGDVLGVSRTGRGRRQRLAVTWLDGARITVRPGSTKELARLEQLLEPHR